MTNLSARISEITQSAGLFGYNIQMFKEDNGKECVLAEIEVNPTCATEHEARNKAQTALMYYEITGKFPNFSEGVQPGPSPISKVRELRKLAGCTLAEALAALNQANAPRFAGDVLLALAALQDEDSAHDRSTKWRNENPALDRAFPIPT